MYTLHTSDCKGWCFYRALQYTSSGTRVTVEREQVLFMTSHTFLTVISCLHKLAVNATVTQMYDIYF